MSKKKQPLLDQKVKEQPPPPDQPAPADAADPPARKPKGPVIPIIHILVAETIDLIHKQPSEPIMRGIVRASCGIAIPQELMGDPANIIQFLEEEWTYRQEAKPTMDEYVELEVEADVREIFTTTRTRHSRATYKVEIHNKYVRDAIKRGMPSALRQAIYANFLDITCGSPTYIKKGRKTRPHETVRHDVLHVDLKEQVWDEIKERYGKAI